MTTPQICIQRKRHRGPLRYIKFYAIDMLSYRGWISSAQYCVRSDKLGSASEYITVPLTMRRSVNRCPLFMNVLTVYISLL